jgi:hypothetical protein
MTAAEAYADATEKTVPFVIADWFVNSAKESWKPPILPIPMPRLSKAALCC